MTNEEPIIYICKDCGAESIDPYCINCNSRNVEKKKTYDENDVKELDIIILHCESPYQMERIDGRMEYKKFAARFTEKELKEIAKKIGCTHKPEFKKNSL